MKTLKKTALLLAFAWSALLVAGCSDSERDAQELAKIKRCEEMGGIPIRAIWDGRLADCIFKPKDNCN